MRLNYAYIRLSEEDIGKTKNFSESILNQIELIEEYARNNNIHIDKKFIDEGYSGINNERPAFERMIKEIEKDNVQTIITKDFSRLGREFIETSFYIIRFFPEHNIRYIAINESYDSIQKNNDSKEMIVGIKDFINDCYIRDTSKKIKAVKEQKTENCYYMGFIAPYGYKKIREKNGRITLKEDEKVSCIVKEIFQNIINEKTRNQIAEELNAKNIPSPMKYMNMTKSRCKNYYDKWTSGIIYRIIRNVTYTGNTYKRKSSKENYKQRKREYIRLDKREIILNTHPAIIDLNTFQNANSMVKTNKQKTNRLKNYKGKLNGLVVCGECGKVMNVSGRKKENGRVVYAFYCTNGKNENQKCNNNKIIFTNKLEDIVYSHIRDILEKLDDDKIAEESCRYIIEKRKSKREIDFLNKEIEIGKIKIKELYLQKVYNQISLEEFAQKRNEIKEQNEIKEKQIMQISNDMNGERQKDEIRKRYKEFKNENNLMKYIDNLVKEIRFYEDRKIEINLMLNE